MRIKLIIILSLLAVIIVAPALQQFTGLIKNKGLAGYYPLHEQVDFSIKTWFDGRFQDSKSEFLRLNTGFFPDFVRLKNQYEYSLFNKVNSTLVVGKDRYLFEIAYINAYRGIDFLGEDSIAKKVSKLKYISDQLQKHETKLIVVLCPSKAGYYSEYLPAEHSEPVSLQNNYKSFLEHFSHQKIDFIDTHDWFMKMKDRSEYSLIPKYGAHWSMYGSVLAQDSLIRYMEASTNTELLKFTQRDIEISTHPRYTDADLLRLLNLISSWKSPPMAYPVLDFDKQGKKPTVISISDSYYWSFYETGVLENCFSENSKYWFYYDNVYGIDKKKKEGSVDEIDKLTALYNADFVLMTCTEANLKDFAYGFIDEVYQLMKEDGI